MVWKSSKMHKCKMEYSLRLSHNIPSVYTLPSRYDFIKGQLIVMEGNIEIGDNCEIQSFVKISDKVKIGNNVTIKEYTRIDKGAQIGDNVQIRGHSVLCSNMIIEGDNDLGHSLICTNHPKLNKFHGIDEMKPPIIKKFARIGASVTLMPGVIVGKNSIVGAYSLVTKNIPDYEVWKGTPSKFYRKITEDEFIE